MSVESGQPHNRSAGRMIGTRDNLESLSTIRKLFSGATPEIQRQIAVSIFSALVLKDRKLSVSLKAPFVFLAKSKPTGILDQEPFAQQSLQQQVT